jgi:ABC-type nitrate/sulfonate/bicarbonate transport system substrate-binding protein
MIFGGSGHLTERPLWLAGEKDYYANANLKLIEYASVAEVMQAFRDGKAQVASMTLGDAMQLRRDVPALKIILLLGTPDNASPDMGKDLEVLIVRDGDVGNYHRELVALVQGWRLALNDLNTDPKFVTQLGFHLSKDVQSVSVIDWQHNRDLLRGDPPPIASTLDAVQRSLLSQGLIQMGGDATTLIEPALLSEKDAMR